MTNWHLTPTETRRFKHTTGFHLVWDINSHVWDAYIFVERTEVWPGVYCRIYQHITTASIMRLTKLGKTNMRVSFYRNNNKARWVYTKID